MKEKILEIKSTLDSKLDSVSNLKELNDLRVIYLGKKGPISELTSLIGTLPVEEGKEAGALINSLKLEVTEKIEAKRALEEEKALNERLESEKIDITLPATNMNTGSIHPLTRIIEEVEDLFISMGYDVVEGPEVEQDLYCFERLNLPKGHPARDMQDTFYITDEMLLRSQTSAVQAHVLEENEEKTAIRVICPGRVFRRDEDATHSHHRHKLSQLGQGYSGKINSTKLKV